MKNRREAMRQESLGASDSGAASASGPASSTADYESAVAADPRDALSLKRLAILKTQDGDLDGAVDYFRRFLELEPHDLGVLKTLGRVMLAQGDATGAQSCYERALQIDPKDGSACEFLAHLHFAAGRHEEAIAGYRKAVEIDQSLSGSHSRLGAMLYALDEISEARTHLEMALEIDGNDADAHNNLGNVLIAEGSAADAIGHYQMAATINPSWAPPQRNRGRALTKLGRKEEAITAYREALRLVPADPEMACALADGLAAAGKLDEAIDVLKAARERAPDDAETLFSLGVNYLARRDWEDAVAIFEKASAIVPDSPDILNNLACAYLEVEQYDAAIETAKRATAADPSYALAYNTMASSYTGKFMFEESARACDRALELDPTLFAAAHNRGLVLRRLGRVDEARRQLEAAVRISPDSPEGYAGLALLHRELDETDKAVAYYRKAISVATEPDEHVYGLATLLQSEGRADDLRAEGRRLVSDDPKRVAGYLLQAMGLSLDKGRRPETERVLLAALDIDPDDQNCLMALADQYHSQWRLEEAAAVYERILEHSPDNPKILAQLLDVNLSQCNWKGYEKFSRDLIGRVKSDIAKGTKLSADVFSLQALPLDYAFIAAAARNKAKADAEEMAWAKPSVDFSFRPHDRKKIRIGYVLAYTWFHSLPLVLKEIIERHDRSHFEVYGYSLQLGNDTDFDRSYRAAFDQFRDLKADSPVSAARAIYQDDLDILIDVAGQTAVNAMSILTFRPAPVQAHYLGYSITTGADYVDYLITDDTYIPGELEAHCSEALVRLPDTFMATTRAEISAEPTCRADHDLPKNAFVLCNFNHPCKFEPEIFGAWMRIMTRLPNSVLWLGDWSDATRKNLRREAKDRGVSGSRLIFAPIMEHAAHCGRLGLADVAVDPHYHGGGITTVDALWCGVPVVTICGKTPSSRLGATLLKAAEVPETITGSLNEYEDLVVALANDPERLKKLRRKIWDRRLTCPLFDTARHVRGLERAFAAMWKTYRAGEAPHPIRIPRES